MHETIYFDNQAATPIDPAVLTVVNEAMAKEFGNPSSDGHRPGWAAREAVERARSSIAAGIGAEPDEVIFTSGATEADNLGVLGAALGAPPNRRRILVGATEHKAVLEAAIAAADQGFSVETISVDRRGVIDVADLEQRLGSDVAIISVMAVNNEIGTIQDVTRIARLGSGVGAFVHCDATQALAAMDVDVAAWGIDAASFSSHKIYGPKGVGAFFLSAAAPWRPRPLMFGGGQEGGLRPGTLPAPLCIGFAEAMAIMIRNGATERDGIASLRDKLAAGLKRICPEVIQTSLGVPRHPGNLHVRFDGIDADDLLFRLQPTLAASTGSACTSGSHSPSHVLKALGHTDWQASEGIRFSIGRFNTDDEVDRAVELIGNVLGCIDRKNMRD